MCPEHGGERVIGSSQGWRGRRGHDTKSLIDLNKDPRFWQWEGARV